MYVCLCNGVTDGQIRREIQGGAQSVIELQQRLGVANQCGICWSSAQSVLKQSRTVDIGKKPANISPDLSFVGATDEK